MQLPEKKVTDIPPLPSQAPPQPPPLPPQQAAPSPPPGLELVVETLAGQLIPVEGCAASDTVLAVKLWIEAAEGIPPDQQRLLIGAEQVRTHLLLSWLVVACGILDLVGLVKDLCVHVRYLVDENPCYLFAPSLSECTLNPCFLFRSNLARRRAPARQLSSALSSKRQPTCAALPRGECSFFLLN